MPEINKKQAKSFLENLSKNDQIIIIHHDDLDGFASGILLFDYCKNKNLNVKNIPFSYTDNQQKVINQTKKANKIIITDLGPEPISEILKQIKNKDVLYIDHHQKTCSVPKNILELRTTSQGYIPCSRTAYELCSGKYWLAIAGTISDMGHLHKINKTFLDNFLNKKRISQKKFLEDIVFTLNKTIIYFSKKPKKAFNIIRKLKSYKDVKKLKKFARPVEKEIQKYLKEYKTKKEQLGIVSFYYLNPKYPVKSTISSQLSFMNKDDIIILAKPEKDLITFSGRTQNKKANMIDVLKTGIKGLKDSSAGGHIPAAGGHIKQPDLITFKKNLENYSF